MVFIDDGLHTTEDSEKTLVLAFCTARFEVFIGHKKEE